MEEPLVEVIHDRQLPTLQENSGEDEASLQLYLSVIYFPRFFKASVLLRQKLNLCSACHRLSNLKVFDLTWWAPLYVNTHACEKAKRVAIGELRAYVLQGWLRLPTVFGFACTRDSRQIQPVVAQDVSISIYRHV